MGERKFFNSGIRVCRVRGIDLWIHWALILWFAYILYLKWTDKTLGGLQSILESLLWWTAILGTTLIHEIGHCWMAFRQGGGADAIVLWPLGGLAFCDAPRLPRNQFWVAAGGILFQLVPTALSGLGYLALARWAAPTSEAVAYAAMFLGALFWWNLLLIIFNLLPIYPLDGGRMLQTILWARFGYGKGTVITVWVSRIGILVAAVLVLFVLQDLMGWLALAVFIWAFFETERLWVRLQSGEDEESLFGYDFSRGYTSVERTATRDRPTGIPIFGKLIERRRANRREREADVRRRVDELLEKISREGMASLSARERKFLDQASKKFRQND